MKKFIFCHGFGASPKFWTPLKKHFDLNNCIFWDLGYFEDAKQDMPKAEEHDEWIGIGHSIGFIKLLQSSISFKAVIGLQGFVNFLGNSPTLNKARRPYLEKMVSNFKSFPDQTLLKFYEECGFLFPTNYVKKINFSRLLNDLESLRQDYTTCLKQTPYLILGSRNDPIVPPKLLGDNFHSVPKARIVIHNEGKHTLGYTEVKFVFEQIKIFMSGINEDAN